MHLILNFYQIISLDCGFMSPKLVLLGPFVSEKILSWSLMFGFGRQVQKPESIMERAEINGKDGRGQGKFRALGQGTGTDTKQVDQLTFKENR